MPINFFPEIAMVVAIAVYLIIFILSILVLLRLVILLPILTDLASVATRHLRSFDDLSPDRRLLQIEDLLRLKKITPEEYEAKRKDILNDL